MLREHGSQVAYHVRSPESRAFPGAGVGLGPSARLRSRAGANSILARRRYRPSRLRLARWHCLLFRRLPAENLTREHEFSAVKTASAVASGRADRRSLGGDGPRDFISSNGRHQPGPRARRRRPGRHPRRVQAAPVRRGLRRDGRPLAGRGAGAAGGLGLRPRDPRLELHARYHVRPGGLRPDGTDPVDRSRRCRCWSSRPGAAWRARSRRCAAGRATTSRSRGTTNGCS